ncbi:MAG TPA: 4'-phosphopantetheinyl transferase superfamily protein [Cellvibrionaceae bacterium]
MRIIDVFLCRLADFNGQSANDRALYLDAQELVRFERFKFDQHRQAFLASRVLLKTALASRLNCAISQLAFTSGPQGKPELIAELNQDAWQFNLTHSDKWALVAIDKQAVGIDTENMQRSTNILNIARHNFHPLEVDFLTGKANEPRWGFYYWMLKEAYIKYLGVGLSQSLLEFYFVWQQPLLFGSEKSLPVPAAAVFSWAEDEVAALCYSPSSNVTLRVQQLTREGVWVPLDFHLLTQTAAGLSAN